MLLVGRSFSGVGTALLYSTFDAWYKFEHEARRFPKEWVSSTFSKQAFGDSILAILSGLVASVATEYIGEFDFHVTILVAHFHSISICYQHTLSHSLSLTRLLHFSLTRRHRRLRRRAGLPHGQRRLHRLHLERKRYLRDRWRCQQEVPSLEQRRSGDGYVAEIWHYETKTHHHVRCRQGLLEPTRSVTGGCGTEPVRKHHVHFCLHVDTEPAFDL